MIKDDPQALSDEIKGAEEWRNQHLRKHDEMLKQTVGPAFREDAGAAETLPENNYFEYVSLNMPRLVFDNPRLRITSSVTDLMMQGPGGEMSAADELRHVMNKWCRDERLAKKLRPPVMDGFFAFGSGHVFSKEYAGAGFRDGSYGLEPGQRPKYPCFKHLLPRNRFWDPIADARDEIRFSGHKYYGDKEQLLEKADQGAGWDKAAIRNLQTGTAVRNARRTTTGVERGEVEVYEVWVPEHTSERDEEDGFHGKLYTIAYTHNEKRDPVFIRDPRPFFGPEWGPYQDWGGYTIGDDTFWLAPLVGLHQNVEYHNSIARAVQKANRKYKHGIAVSDADPDLQRRIKGFMDHGVLAVNVEDLGKMLKEITVGGATPELYEALDRARDNYERTSGINDARRGSLAGAGSATEVAIADSAATVRFDYIKRQFQSDFVVPMLRTAGWYFMEDPRSRYPIGPEVAQKMGFGPDNYWWGPPEDGIPFESYEFDLEMYSMERVDEGLHQKRILDYIGAFSTIVQLAMAIGPEAADWNGTLQFLADSLNLPDFGLKLNLGAIGQARAEQMLMGSQGGSGGRGSSGAAQASVPMTMGQMNGLNLGAAVGGMGGF